MSFYDYDGTFKPWVSPKLVLVYYDKLSLKYRSNFSKEFFKKVKEAKIAALALLGVHKLNKIPFMMQVPKDVNNSPDIVTMNLKECDNKPVQMEIQDIEIVEYLEREKDDIATFLKNKKLDPGISKKAYDDKTIVICSISKSRLAVNLPDLHNKIKKISPKATVYLLGQFSSSKPGKHFRLTRIWPQLDASIEFDAIKEAMDYPKPDACKFRLGSSKRIKFDTTKVPLPTPSEVFELKEEEL